VHADPRLAADEYFREIALTSQRLAQFETTTAALTQSVEHIRTLEANVGTAATRFADLLVGVEGGVGAATKRLAELITGLERAIRTFDVSTQTNKQLAKKLDQFEAMSDRLRELLDHLPERLNDPLKNMSLTAGKFREAMLSGEAAFRELKAAAGATGESLTQTAERANATWDVLHDMQASLEQLAQHHEERPTAVTGPGPASGDGHPIPGHRGSQQVADPRRTRPWWRIFG
jgi:ABC-type transporter Mla subunit MlaD